LRQVLQTRNIIVLLLFFLPLQMKGQEKAFHGTITYSNKEFDSEGNALSTLVNSEQYFFNEGKILVKTTSGPQIFILGNVDVYLDADNFKRSSPKLLSSKGTISSGLVGAGSLLIRPLS
ncbi:MAG: hypothetical protein ACKO96_37760, partial [Flammeovirgaceae bacterium]